MRKLFLVLFWISLSLFEVHAQNWKVVTPFNSANVIRDMETTPNGMVYVIAQSPIRMYKTQDGLSWVPIVSSISGNPADMFMLDDNKGYLISSSGVLSRTNDAWKTSSTVNYGGVDLHNRVFFLNENIGFIAGYVRFIKKTLDAGQTWSYLTIPSTLMVPGENVTDIRFINDQIGFVTTSNGKVIKTTDQGLTWSMTQLQSSSYELNRLLFVNDQIGLAVGSLGEVYRTTDQGNTWTLIASGLGYVSDIRLRNGVLYLVGGSRGFTLSTDLGLTWSTAQTVNVTGGNTGILRLYALTFLGNDILVAGENGIIFKANNALGSSWTYLYQPILGATVTRDMKFFNQNQGVMVGAGSTGAQSAFYFTENGGQTWQRKAVAANGVYKASLDLKSDGRGLMVGQSGYSVTTNFGQTWTAMTSIQPSTAYTKCWLKGNNDFFVGTNPGSPPTDGMIRRSGTTWSQFTNMYQIGAIKFADEQVGFAGTGTPNYTAKMWKTTDGGVSWNELPSYIGGTVSEIQVINSQKIYVTGSNGLSLTEDGGQTWNFITNFPSTFHFFDALNAYGIDFNTLDISKTEDGGQTWTVLIQNDNSICGVQNFAWFPNKIIQSGGEFLVCIIDIDALLQVKPNDVPSANKKIIAYPNPAKNILNISESVKYATLVDIYGKILATYNQVRQIDVSGYQKGIYFLDVVSESGYKQVIKVSKE